jgi:hypothetical protein
MMPRRWLGARQPGDRQGRAHVPPVRAEGTVRGPLPPLLEEAAPDRAVAAT